MRLLREKTVGNRRGFTLIELMIVVALIGILTTIAFPLYANIQARVRVAKARADLRTLASAATVYAAHAGSLPPSLNNLTSVTTVNGVAVGPFIRTLPTRPNTAWTNYAHTLLPGGTFRITTSSAADGASLVAP
jgi:prepilin-type N-terminal cleavage/methylation domain-containing protein